MYYVNGFVFYDTYLEILNELNGEDFKAMVNAMMEFMQNGVEPNFEDTNMRIIFKSLKPNLESNKNKYLDRINSAMRNNWKKEE